MIHLVSPFQLCPCGVVHRAAPPRAAKLRPYRDFYVSTSAKNSILNQLASISPYGGVHSAYSTTGVYEPGSTIGTGATFSESGTDVTVTVASALAVGEQVTISGASVSGYNGTWTVTSVQGTFPNYTSFHYTNTSSGLGAGTGGTVVLYAGSPSYARSALTWASASGGSVALATTLPSWNVQTGFIAAWVSLWTAVSSGTLNALVPVGGGTLRPCSVESSTDESNADIYTLAHGYAQDTRVVFWATLPGGLAVGTIYWVIATGLTANSFRVSTTQGGSAVTLSGSQPFNFFVQSCTPQVFASPSLYALDSLSIDAAVVV